MRAVAVAALLGCTPSRDPAPVPVMAMVLNEPVVDVRARCFIADTSAPARDTLYTVGVEPPTDALLDCAGRDIPYKPSPVLVPVTLPQGADLRDVLDRGAPRPDVVVTHNPDVLAYAARSKDWFVDSLPWVTTYVLVSADSAPPLLSAVERAALARDAVSADARGASEPLAWLTDTSCAQGIALQPERTPFMGFTFIGYAEGDATARQLAERISARAATARRVQPFAGNFLPLLLGNRQVVEVVMAVARDPGTKCGTRNNARVLRGAVPLVDTRAHVIVRRGSGAAFIVAADGSLRFIRRAAQ